MRMTQYEQDRYIRKLDVPPIVGAPMPPIRTRGKGYVKQQARIGQYRYAVTRQIACNSYYLGAFDDEETAAKMGKAYDKWLRSFKLLSKMQAEYRKLKQLSLDEKIAFLSEYF